ncbi:MAG: hypothetical protein A2341_16330 [Deltaproteobacteria bacterium RIFOXYB12_FULL_58_9]|nr:MAG: hypothetical protein A2341_16330 [Deltaproteobacteria bacterium RIFOXYB12_FULL_58_9]
MTLKEALSSRRARIHEKWLEVILSDYSPEGAGLFGGGKDRFANPVGFALREHTRSIVDNVLAGQPADAHLPSIEAVVKIRSVQEMPPSQAVGFVVSLKAVLRREGEDVIKANGREELDELESAIDELLLVAFDAYARGREQIFDIRVNETKRTVSGLIRRLNRIDQERHANDADAREMQT